MRISDWSSDVCSSDLKQHGLSLDGTAPRSTQRYVADRISAASGDEDDSLVPDHGDRTRRHADGTGRGWAGQRHAGRAAGDAAPPGRNPGLEHDRAGGRAYRPPPARDPAAARGPEHTG